MLESPPMDISPIIDGLNAAQREAVCAEDGNLLILAGAGSGKTRVLVHRIAWLIQRFNISPGHILAVTFTNKAANEMRGRLEQLLHMPTRGLWVGTFHGLAHRLLRRHWQDAHLPENFQILDSDDQQRLIKRLIRDNGLDEKEFEPRRVQGFINGCKDEGQRPGSIEHWDRPDRKTLVRLYQLYEDFCQRAGLVDFAELLLRAHELWLQHPALLQHYQQRFAHLLIDEFQDTNAIQYAWLRLLAGRTGKVFIVGDDDQSIYGWRGAKVENIQRAQHDFPGTRTIRLEQNYRSTGNILEAANALIANNSERLGKNLWTSGDKGEPIYLYEAFNELDEARFVVERIRQWLQQGGRRDQAAILYRSNAQSRVFEEALLQQQVPYRVYGGLRFFERQEIKDALAYLRLLAIPHDDAACERVINTPTRGIGERSLESLRGIARERGISLWQAMETVLREQTLPGRASQAIQRFQQLIGQLAAATRELSLAEMTAHVVEHSGLLAMYKEEKGERGQARVENLEELVNAARQYDNGVATEDSDMSPLMAFLSHAALEAGEGQAEAWQDCVQLMTLHAAKGLEFPLVFLCGVEEGLFPSERSLAETGRLEEERRLCYVGMTRAMRTLYICYAENRRLHGSERYSRPSRFIQEIPAQLLQSVRLRGSVQAPVYRPTEQVAAAQTKESRPRLGQRVVHGTFGEGVVLNYEGAGAQARVQVNFDRVGSKWLMLDLARLQYL